MNLTLDDLKNKSLPGVQKVLSLSFEYLLATVGKEYSILIGFKTVEEFNSKNTLDFSKILLYPFFVSLSNGHSKSLYSLFGDFYALSFGPVSLSVFGLINNPGEKTTLQYFNLDGESNPIGIQIIPTSPDNTQTSPEISFENIKENIKKTEVQFLDGNTPFEEIFITSNLDKSKEIYLAIESGVKAIKEQSSSFFNADAEVMKLHASYFDAFKKRLKANDTSVIEYTELEEGNKRPFYLDEKNIIE